MIEVYLKFLFNTKDKLKDSNFKKRFVSLFPFMLMIYTGQWKQFLI